MQVPVLKEVLDALNIPRYEMEGWEADDLIGTISRRCEAAGWDCVVVTGDKDSLQLITEHTKVKLVSTRMGQTTTKDMTPETFREQYGFEPIHMIDLKALMGDTSDNIPGVPGVGEKTAMDLIQKYGSIDAVYEKLPDIDAKPAAIKKLTAGEDAARHSYWLATIVTDAPLSFDPAENRVQEPTPAAYPLFLKLEFSKLIEKMGLRPEETAPADAVPDVTVTAERDHGGIPCPGGAGTVPQGGSCDGAGPAGPLRGHCGLRYRGGYRPVGGIFLRALHRRLERAAERPVRRRH